MPHVENAKTYFVYKIQSDIPHIGMYVGVTTRPKARKGEHWKNSSGAKLRAAISLYGADRFDFTVIEEYNSLEDALNGEKFWIRELNTGWPNGLNVLGTGEGAYSKVSYEHVKDNRTKGLIKRWSDNEKRLKQSETLKRVMNSEEVKKASSEAAKKRWADPAYRAKQAEAKVNSNYKHSDETKKKLGDIRRKIYRDKHGEPKGRPTKYGSVKNGEITRTELAALCMTPDVRKKVSDTWESNRDKNVEIIRKTNQIHNKDPEVIKKRSEGLKRYFKAHGAPKMSEEAKKRMSDSQKQRWAKIKAAKAAGATHACLP